MVLVPFFMFAGRSRVNVDPHKLALFDHNDKGAACNMALKYKMEAAKGKTKEEKMKSVEESST